MKVNCQWLKQMAKLGFLFLVGASMSAEAGLFGFGDVSWKEEVLLHDDSKDRRETVTELRRAT